MKTRTSTQAGNPSAPAVLGIVGGAAVLATAGYLLVARAAGYEGFPLDDAWIHQT